MDEITHFSDMTIPRLKKIIKGSVQWKCCIWAGQTMDSLRTSGWKNQELIVIIQVRVVGTIYIDNKGCSVWTAMWG